MNKMDYVYSASSISSSDSLKFWFWFDLKSRTVYVSVSLVFHSRFKTHLYPAPNLQMVETTYPSVTFLFKKNKWQRATCATNMSRIGLQHNQAY